MKSAGNFPLLTVVFFVCILAADVACSAGVSRPQLDLPDTLIQKKFLPNGMTVLLQSSRDYPLAGIEIIVKTGSVFERENYGSGLAHLVEHMIFKGTKQRSADALAQEVRSMGGYFNGYTSHQVTGYSLVVPARHLEKALELLQDMIANPLFDEEELVKEKEVILSEIRMNRDNPQRYLNFLFWKNMYPGPPYNLPVIGLEEIFLSLTRDDAVRFFRKWYVPNNMVLSLAGDFETAAALETVEKLFGAVPLQSYPDAVLPKLAFIDQEKEYAEEFDTDTTRMIIGFPTVDLSSGDAAALDVLAVILGEGKSSRLYRSLVEEKKLVYSVNAVHYTPRFTGFFAVACTLDYERKDEVIRAVSREIERLINQPAASWELEKVKNNYLYGYISSRETVLSRAQAAAADEAYTGDPFFSRGYIRKAAAVGAADIQRCAGAYLKESRRTTVLLHPRAVPKEPDIRAAPAVSSGAKKIVLDNGLTLILQKNISRPAVSLDVIFGGGTRRETPQNNGVFNILSSLMLRGTRKFSAAEISRFTESRGMHLSAFSGYYSFGLTMECLGKDTEQAVLLAADIVWRPVFPEKELAQEKRLTIQKIAVQADDIFRDTLHVLRENLFDAHPFGLRTLGKKETVESFTRAQMIELHKQFCRPNNAVISIVGDFDEEKVIAGIRKHFSSWPAGAIPYAEPVMEPPRQEQKTVEHRREKEQAVIMFGFPGVPVSDPDRYALEILVSYLSGHGSVLYNRIRESLGLAYALGGQTVCGGDGGYIFIYAAVHPEAVTEVREIVEEELRKLSRELPSAEEFAPVRNYLIGSHWRGLESFGALSLIMGLDELYGLGCDYYRGYEDKINACEEETLRRAARQYLDPEQSVVVITRR